MSQRVQENFRNAAAYNKARHSVRALLPELIASVNDYVVQDISVETPFPIGIIGKPTAEVDKLIKHVVHQLKKWPKAMVDISIMTGVHVRVGNSIEDYSHMLDLTPERRLEYIQERRRTGGFWSSHASPKYPDIRFLIFQPATIPDIRYYDPTDSIAILPHEFGHHFDCILGLFSNSDLFKENYEADLQLWRTDYAPEMPLEVENILKNHIGYFLPSTINIGQQEDMSRARSESFAQLFSERLCNSYLKSDNTLQHILPRSYFITAALVSVLDSILMQLKKQPVQNVLRNTC